jgi:hypothetical protein
MHETHESADQAGQEEHRGWPASDHPLYVISRDRQRTFQKNVQEVQLELPLGGPSSVGLCQNDEQEEEEEAASGYIPIH